VFIIQTKGSKLYLIRPSTIHPGPLVSSIPKDLGYEKETSDVEIKVLLKEGDWPYLPSGWWHIARTQKESMHISICLMPRSAVDIADFLPKYLAARSFWRTRLPIHQEFPDEKSELDFYQDAFGALGKDLVNIISSPDFITSFLKRMRR
jgi:50S ribosomal protein L16 3-hydroxylase